MSSLIKNKFFIEVSMSHRLHPAYGVVYTDYRKNSDICCPLPFNLILRPIYLLWCAIHYWPKRTRLEAEIKRVEENKWKVWTEPDVDYLPNKHGEDT